MRLGIIGVGGMGSHHLRTVRDGRARDCELTAICDIREEQMTPYEDVRKFTDSAELIRSGEVDAVVIATPHYQHTTIGIDALEQGLHVLSEKPISVHKADAERLIAAHSNKDQVFVAMFNQRTDPHYRAIKKLIDTGELGEIQRVNWIITNWYRTQAYYDSGGWRATWEGEGGGVLVNQCPHNLDLLQWLCGMPCRLYARCSLGKYHNIEVEDEVTAYFEYPNGATGVFITTTGESPGTNRLEICGDRGKLVYEGDPITFHRTDQSVKEFGATAPGAFATPGIWKCEIPASGNGPQHLGILQNFIDAIERGAEVIAPAEEGIHSVELANAMIFSSLEGRMIDLPLDGAAYEQRLKQLIAESDFQKDVKETGPQDLSGSFNL